MSTKHAGILVALLLICSGGLFAQGTDERESANVLTIGNSFADNAASYLPAIAKAGGKQLTLSKANIGGCSLEKHATILRSAEADPAQGRSYKSFFNPSTREKVPSSLPEALSAYDWDFVTIQQVSHQSYKAESFHPYVDEIMAAIHKYAPQAEILVHETWAYRVDHRYFEKEDWNQKLMYEGLIKNYRNLADENDLRILPSGDAIQLARQDPLWKFVPDPDFDLENPEPGTLPNQDGSLLVGWRWLKEKDGSQRFHRDAIHANEAGRYLIGCVWYLVIFNANELPDYCPKELSEEQAASLRKIALQAVQAERARASN